MVNPVWSGGPANMAATDAFQETDMVGISASHRGAHSFMIKKAPVWGGEVFIIMGLEAYPYISAEAAAWSCPSVDIPRT